MSTYQGNEHQKVNSSGLHSSYICKTGHGPRTYCYYVGTITITDVSCAVTSMLTFSFLFLQGYDHDHEGITEFIRINF